MATPFQIPSELAKYNNEERETLMLAAYGYCPKEISVLLNVPVSTIRGRIMHIYQKTDTHSLVHALAKLYGISTK